MRTEESHPDEPWDRLKSLVASSDFVWADVDTLLRFRDDADSSHPMYLFWDIYQPTLKDSEGARSPAPRLVDQDENSKVRLEEAMSEAGRERDMSRLMELVYEYTEVGKQLDWAQKESNPNKSAMLEILELLYHRHRVLYEPDGDDSEIRAFLEAHDEGPPDSMAFPVAFKNALVLIHVAAARAFKLHQTDGFSEEVSTCLADVERTLDRLYRAGFDHKTPMWQAGPTRLEGVTIYHSILAVSAISFVSLSRMSRAEGRYTDALHYLARAGELYEYSLPTPMGLWDTWPLGLDSFAPNAVSPWEGDLEYFLTGLPISVTQFTELIEELRADRRSVNDWRSLAADCLILANQRMCWRFHEIEEADPDGYFEEYNIELHDLEELEQSEDIHEVLAANIDRVRVDDGRGSTVNWGEFWHSAAAWATAQLSPSEYRKMRDADEKEAAERRLQRYFFGSSWSRLPKRAQERLINADINWNSTQRVSRETILNDLQRATEEICYWYLPKFLEKAEPNYPDVLDARDIRKYIEICERKEFWDGLDECEQQFLTENLPASMRQLADSRNLAEHETGQSMSESKASADSAYRLFLGIGRKGILPKLTRIALKYGDIPTDTPS